MISPRRLVSHMTSTAHTPRDAAGSRTPAAGLLILIVVAGVVVMQSLRSRGLWDSVHAKPGPERGDVALENSCLGESYDGWTKVSFTPPPRPEELPDTATAWSHTWRYQRGDLQALVSFDQAHFDHWHDLTICYRGAGWEMKQQKAIACESSATGTWEVVLVRFEKGSQDRATLLFSLFDESGSPICPPEFDDAKNPAGIEFLGKLTYRITASPKTYERVHQCQVFVPHVVNLTDQQIAEVLELHRVSREQFRRAWLRHLKIDPVASRQLGSVKMIAASDHERLFLDHSETYRLSWLQ